MDKSSEGSVSSHKASELWAAEASRIGKDGMRHELVRNAKTRVEAEAIRARLVSQAAAEEQRGPGKGKPWLTASSGV